MKYESSFRPHDLWMIDQKIPSCLWIEYNTNAEPHKRFKVVDRSIMAPFRDTLARKEYPHRSRALDVPWQTTPNGNAKPPIAKKMYTSRVHRGEGRFIWGCMNMIYLNISSVI